MTASRGCGSDRAISSAWYDERTNGPLATSAKPRLRASRPSSSNSVGGQVAHDGKMSRRRLKVLAEREQVAADRAEVGQGFDDLLGRLAQAEHQAALGAEVRARSFDVLEHREADRILALAPDVLLEPGDGLEVVVEHLGSGREDDVDQFGRGRRSRA